MPEDAPPYPAWDKEPPKHEEYEVIKAVGEIEKLCPRVAFLPQSREQLAQIISAAISASAQVRTDTKVSVLEYRADELLLALKTLLCVTMKPPDCSGARMYEYAMGVAIGKEEQFYPSTWLFVFEFARLMEGKLEKNRHKGDREGWLRKTPQDLLFLLRKEVEELEGALNSGSPEDVESEAADVANFAMMVMDSFREAYGYRAYLKLS